MSYRVLIPTAGIGSRLGKLTKYINKSLIGIANRPAISHVIEQFPEDTEFVIALGHKGDLVKEFLTLAYSDRTFFFAGVSPFEGEGSGLGLSVLKCKEYLQQPFIFISCDTLVRGKIPNPTTNWMGYAEITDLQQYRTLEIQGNQVVGILEKGVKSDNIQKAYIGLAGIKNYAEFWNAMENGGSESIVSGESHGLRAIVKSGIVSYCFTWYDTGNIGALKIAREAYREADEPNILEKENETIWFVKDNAVKYSDDKKFIANRVLRADSIKGYIPEIIDSATHMYVYKKANGHVLSEVITIPLFKQLLNYSKAFWQIHNLDDEGKSDFKNKCMVFYKKKTIERVELFFKNFGKNDSTETINGIPMPTIAEIFEKVDWNWLADGLPGRFHGDFHFENIIYDKTNNKFVFLDWRQDFGGSLTTGDIYYDFAKLLHGLIVCHELIAENHFVVDWKEKEIKYDLYRKNILVQCERFFEDWLTENQYDKKKVWILTAIVYLNIAALHHYPYSLMLFALGKEMLFNSIGKK